MPRQTRKQKAGQVAKPKARPAKKRPEPKVKPCFKPDPSPPALPSVLRVRCPLCDMMTEFNNFLAADPHLQFYEQTFGGRLLAPRGTKPGQKSKAAPGFMEYREVTDPSCQEYQDVVEVIKVRMGNISEAVLGGPLTFPESKPIMQRAGSLPEESNRRPALLADRQPHRGRTVQILRGETAVRYRRTDIPRLHRQAEGDNSRRPCTCIISHPAVHHRCRHG